MINTLDKRHGKPAVIHHAHPHRIAGTFAGAPRRGTAVVNPVGKRLKGGGCQQCLNIRFQLARIGNVRIAQAKGQLGGFNNTVNRSRIVSLRHIQAVGDAEYRQRDQPLRRRGVVINFSLLMLQLQRRGAPGDVGV